MSAGAAGAAAAQGFKSFIRKSALRAIPKPVEPIPNWHIVRGDTVIVLRGRDKGKTGKVKSVIRARNRLVVEGVNLVRSCSRLARRAVGRSPVVVGLSGRHVHHVRSPIPVSLRLRGAHAPPAPPAPPLRSSCARLEPSGLTTSTCSSLPAAGQKACTPHGWDSWRCDFGRGAHALLCRQPRRSCQRVRAWTAATVFPVPLES
jgi:hypothetical protein